MFKGGSHLRAGGGWTEARRKQMNSILNGHPAGKTLLPASQREATSLGISLGARREFLREPLFFYMTSARSQLFWTTPPTSFCCVIPFISVSSFSSDPFSFHNKTVDEELVYSLTVKTSSGQMPLLALWGQGGPNIIDTISDASILTAYTSKWHLI